MQTTVKSLSGRSLFAYAKKCAILAASITFSIFILSNKIDQPLQKAKPVLKKDLTAVVNKMAEVKPNIHKSIAHASGSSVDAGQLKQSNWYKAVKENIEKTTYYIVADKGAKIFSSANIAQNIKANYNQTKVTLQPLQSIEKKHTANNDWQLNINVNGLFADGQLISNTSDQTNNAASNADDVEYNFGNAYSIQYHNDAKGVRQNFLIKEKPAPNVREIKVSLKAEGSWVVNKVHDKELHFAKQNSKGELESKIVYNDLKVWDATGKPLPAKMEVKADNNFEIHANVENAVYPVTIDPLSSTPSSTLAGTAVGSFFAGSIASAGDVNGDGYSDVIVGSVGVSGNTGAAYIFLGSASGLSASPATTLNGIAALDSFGISVSSAGDINGDGFSDVIVGAKGVSSHTGAAYIYLGSASGLSATPSAILNGISANDNFGTSVANAGDLNNDGFSDVIVGAYGVSTNTGAAYIYLGSASGIASGASASSTLNGASIGDRFGITVASAGDIDGDGHSDIIVGAPFHSLATGAAYIYLGSNLTSPSATLNGVSPLGGFGVSVSSAGDINGDGYSDVIVGAAAVSSNTGAAYIYVGSITGIANAAAPSTTLSGTSTNQFFGISVASAGDMNGDAFSDIVIGAFGVSTNTGAAYIYEGTLTGISNSATPALTINGANAGDNFGASVASSGDINGDGYSDVLVGAPNSSTATGNGYVYQGRTDISTTTNTLSMVGQSGSDRYGISVSSGGDINADGYSDVLVGAIGYSGGILNGAVYVYLGSASGLNTTPSAIFSPDGNQDEVGWDVAAAGDIDGDGYGDILIGAKFTIVSGGASQGVVYIYRGNSSGVPTLSATLSGLNMGDVFGESVSGAGDVNGDGYSDIIIGAPGVSTTNSLGGAAYLYMGSAAGIQSTDVPIVLNGLAANATFGASVAYAGDLNGDGYGDIIIGAPNLGGGYNLQDLVVGQFNTGSGIGSAYVFYGNKKGIANNATADVALTDPSVVDFGISVSSAGDVNGDGFSDVIIGASSGDNTGNPGTAEIFLGTAGGLSTSASTILNGASPGDEFGATVAGAGDVNGDGYSDVIIRAVMPSASNPTTGAAYIYLGGPTGLSSTIATTISDIGANTYLETPGAGAAGNIMHHAVASAGDVNGDGYSDVLVGVYVNNFKTGKTYLYYGNNSVGHNASNVLRLYEPDLTNPIAADNLTKNNFGLGLFAQSPFGTVKGRLVWEVEPNGTPFQGNPITNNIVTTGNQTAYSLIPAGGTELKNLIPKTGGKATKVRVRIQYAASAVTFGQVYSPWIYSQVYLLGGNLGVLPLSVTLTANTSGQNILLNWKASEENDLSAYVVEHSLDGIKFDSLGTVASKGTTGTSSYDFTHYHPSVGVHYYRLREVNKDGSKTYSEIVSAKINGTIEFSIYPNPASDHIVITHSGIISNVARIMNSSGAIVGQYKLNANADQTIISVSGFAKGNYFVEIVNSGFAPKQITVQ